MNKYQQLISTLNQLFQTDQEDLDFGIYRIMNQKRAEINSFLENDLKKSVSDGLSQLEQSGTESLAKELESVISNLKSAGVDPDTAPKVIELKKQLNASNATEDAENDIYSHLVNFFSRYYLEGDFISQRRYKDDVYAIPYQGEEVKLHWANYDQYYIKTTENFSNYSFKLENGKTVTFRLVEASTEQSNNKTQNGQERRFKLHDKDFIKEVDGKLEIYFEYIPLGKKVKQDDLNKKASEKLIEAIPSEFDELKKVLPTKKNKDRTLLEKRLKEYTSKNTFDYFIHKDLGGFLRRELDFYIKNEVLDVDDIEGVLNHKNEIITKVKVFKIIALKIINFLEQLENFQKELWEKRKFITQTDYLITLDRIHSKFYEKIASNNDQIKQWKDLNVIDESSTVDVQYLKDHPFLTIDTNLFPSFRDEIIESIEDIDAETNGVLVNSDNWQALNFLQQKYEGIVQAAHIDPPYNTDSSGFLYKNDYRHSSWLTFMRDRMEKVGLLLDDSASFLCHIDENEYENLYQLFKNYNQEYLSTVVWDKRNPMMGGTGIAIQHEYIIWSSNYLGKFESKGDNVKKIFKKAEELIEKNNGVNESTRSEFASWISKEKGLSGGERAYKYLEDDGRIYRHVAMTWPNPNPAPEQFFVPLIHPVTKKPCPVPSRGWSRTPEKMQELIDKGEMVFGSDETTQPQRKIYLDKNSTKPISSIIYNGRKGMNEIKNLGLHFTYSHPLSLYKELINSVLIKKSGIVIDFFAGSGTTGHATMDLNREDDNNRKYILVEMGEYFDQILKRRIQKAIYTSNWKDGKPQDTEGISQIVKYLKLESYEDTLNNLVFNQTENQQSLLSSNSDLKEDYFLRYMLDVETRESNSLLNIDELKDPFNYSLLITSDNEQKRQRIDVAETFNYLIGLHVSRRFKERDFLIFTGTQHQTNKKVAVVWRNVEETSDKDVQDIINSLETENDIVFVNGQTTASSKKCEVLQLEPEFKKRMFN